MNEAQNTENLSASQLPIKKNPKSLLLFIIRK